VGRTHSDQILSFKKNEFLFTVNIDMHNSHHDRIITSFRTPFWLNDKYWIVICDFILSSSSQIALHTLPLDMSDFPMLLSDVMHYRQLIVIVY
jgi:hypothetical protein